MRALLSTLAAVASSAAATDFVIRRHPVKFSTRGASSPGTLVRASDPHATLDDAGLTRHVLAPLALGGGVIVLAAFSVVAAAVASIDARGVTVRAVSEVRCLPALAAAGTIAAFFSVCAVVFARRRRTRRVTLRRAAFAGWVGAALVACAADHRASATAVANGLSRS